MPILGATSYAVLGPLPAVYRAVGAVLGERGTVAEPLVSRHRDRPFERHLQLQQLLPVVHEAQAVGERGGTWRGPGVRRHHEPEPLLVRELHLDRRACHSRDAANARQAEVHASGVVLVARVDAKRLPHGALEVARHLRIGRGRLEDDLDLRDAGAPEGIRRNLGARDERKHDERRHEAGPRRPHGSSEHGCATRASGARARRRRTRESSAR